MAPTILGIELLASFRSRGPKSSWSGSESQFLSLKGSCDTLTTEHKKSKPLPHISNTKHQYFCIVATRQSNSEENEK